MSKESYVELLKDPRWQRKRLEKLQEADWRCEGCFNDKIALHVHHLKYRRGADPWEYDLSELEVLCESCHEAFHQAKEELLEIINSAGGYLVHKLHGYAQAAASIEANRTTVVSNIRSSAGVDGICDALRSPYFACDPGELIHAFAGGVDSVDIAERIRLRNAALDHAIEQFVSETFPKRDAS